MYPVLLSAAWLATASAAKLPDGYGDDPRTPLSYPFDGVAPLPTGERKFGLELGVRLRRVFLPKPILNLWFFDADDSGWAWIDPRPAVRGTAMGLELGLRGRTANGLFYAEFVDSALAGGYWDDLDTPADHLDGNYVEPSSGLGVLAVGADTAYELHLIPIERTGGRFGLSALMGGGLGVGLLLGAVYRWEEDGVGNPGYARFLEGEPADSRNQVTRLYPIVDVNLGIRANFGDLVALRVEGGLHTLPYLGTSIGVSF